MNVRLAHGTGTVPVDIPDNWINGRCYRPFQIDAAANPATEFQHALADPVGGKTLRTALGSRQNAIVVVDSTFPQVIADLLPPLLAELIESTGLPVEAIRVLLTNSAWNGQDSTFVDRVVPKEIRSKHLVELHDPFDDSASRRIGDLPGDVPIALNAAYVDADARILLGPIYPDLIHGFHGGRSLLLPGIAHLSMIQAIYSSENIENPAVSYGNVRDNPFHLAGIQAIEQAGADYLVCPMVTAEGKVSEVIAGDPTQAFMAAMVRLREKMGVGVKEPMDIIVTAAGGAPYDGTLYRVMNVLSAVQPVLKDDATIVISAEMKDGFGPAPLRELILTSENLKGFHSHFPAEDDLILGRWIAQRYLHLVERHEVIVYSEGLTADELWEAGLTPVGNLAEAIEVAMVGHGQRCKICALPDGPYSLPHLSNG